MKKYIPAGFFGLISLGLLIDCVKLYTRVDWSPHASDSSGIGLYLFGGLLEVKENLPYCDTPKYFWGLCAATVVSMIMTALVAWGVKNSGRK